MTKNYRQIVGIDEAGRGPLAGPVTVGVFVAEAKLKRGLLKILGGKIKDSKQLKANHREEIYHKLNTLKKEGQINFKICHVSNKIIDKRGINGAVKIAISKCLKNISPQSQVRLDGLLKAPERFKNQKTIIKGDERDVFIACASIVAKVSRDRLMTRLSKKYPKYDFHLHKGYGTKLHQKMLKKHGISLIHRKTFI